MDRKAANDKPRGHSNAHAITTAIALEPLGSPRSSLPTFTEADEIEAMASNADAAFVEDVDVEQELRTRYNASQSQSKAPVYRPERSIKSSASSPGVESVSEDAPLLDPTTNDYGSVHGSDDGVEDPNSWVAAEFRGLPWWKRPSVHIPSDEWAMWTKANIRRSSGCSHRFCCLPWPLGV